MKKWYSVIVVMCYAMLTVNAQPCNTPPVPIITAIESTCQPGCNLGGGVFVELSSCGGGATLNYYSDISGTITTGIPVYNQVSPVTIYYACVDNTDATCRSAIQSFTTNPGFCSSPPATAGSNSPVCIGANLTLFSTGGSSYCWSGPNGYSSSQQNPVISNFTAAKAGNYTVTVSNDWPQKTDFLGVARYYACGFSIGTKGYIGTGIANNNATNDFWEYNQVTDSWSQKANFGGTPRFYAVGFSIGSKGYIGTGTNGSGNKKDFWEYDPTNNTWTQKSNFGGVERRMAVGFSIGSKGYIGTGTTNNPQQDFWEYDPVTDLWTQKANFGGIVRYGATGFSIGNKGYIGLGIYSVPMKDFWEYDQATDVWTQRADFGGTTRYFATGFSIGTKGYMGTGVNGIATHDFWEYNQTLDTWQQILSVCGPPRYGAVSFRIGTKGYMGTGMDASPKNDFYEYDPAANPCLAFATTTVIAVPPLVCSSGTVSNNPVCAGQSFTVTANYSGGKPPYSFSWNDHNAGGGPYGNTQSIIANLQTGNYLFDCTITDICGAICTSSVSVAPVSCLDTCHNDTLFINTGIDHITNSAFGLNVADRFWKLVSDPSGILAVPQDAITIDLYSGWHAALFNSHSSNWLGHQSNANVNAAAGDYSYEFAFCLHDTDNVKLNLSLLADNLATVKLNGVPILSTINGPFGDEGYINPATANIGGLFYPNRRNTLRVTITNYGGGTGFNIEGRITGGNNSPGFPGCCCADTTPPVMQCNNNFTVCFDDPPFILNPPVATVDACCMPITITSNAPAIFPVGTTIVTWTATDACGKTSSCQQSITMNPELDVDLFPPAQLCAGTLGSIGISPLGGTPGLGYSYTVTPGNSGFIFPFTTEYTPPNYNAGNYQVTITDANGCTISKPVTITEINCIDTCHLDTLFINTGIEHLTNSTLGIPDRDSFWKLVSVSSGNIPPVDAYTIGTYAGWHIPLQNEYSSTWIGDNATSNTTSLYGDYVYEFYFCLHDTDGVSLSINLVADNDATVFLNCNQVLATAGSNVGFSTPVIGNITGSFLPNSRNIIRVIVHNDDGPSGFNIAGRIVSSSGSIGFPGCCSTDPLPPVIYCTPAITICFDTPPFSLTPPDARVSQCCMPLSVSNNAPPVFPLGTTCVTWTVTDACGRVSTCVQCVTRNPFMHVDVFPPGSLCTGTTGSIAISPLGGTPGFGYSYSIVPGNTTGLIAPLTTYLTSPDYGPGTYTVTITDANGCTASANTTINGIPSPVVTIGSNSPVCLGNPLNLICTGGTDFSWTSTTGFTSAEQNPEITQAALTNSGTYSVTVTDAADRWVRKTDLGGDTRQNGVGFSIGNKGYIGTGWNGGILKKDFWEYNPANDTWTQKANFGGSARYAAVGFCIGTKGYIGTGNNGSVYLKDFWEYNPANNTWTQKLNFGGPARYGAVGFSIGTKGYIGTGITGGNSIPNPNSGDLWEYNPSNNSWTSKATFPGAIRSFAVGFSIGNKGYIGTGYTGTQTVATLTRDFWEYNPANNTWTSKAPFGGVERSSAACFSIGTKGYIGTGFPLHWPPFAYQDFWEYESVTDTWTKKTNLNLRGGAVGFSIGDKGYIGTGSYSDEMNDLWEYHTTGTGCSSSASTNVIVVDCQDTCNLDTFFINTGIHHLTNTPLNFGETDRFWKLISRPSGALASPQNAFVIDKDAGWNGPLQNDNSSTWLGDSPDADFNAAPGDYIYEFYFCLHDTTGISLNINLLADDTAGVYLNGSHILSTLNGAGGGFFNPASVTVRGPFLPNRKNVIRVVVHNDIGPAGFNIAGRIIRSNGGIGFPGCCCTTYPLEIRCKQNIIICFNTPPFTLVPPDANTEECCSPVRFTNNAPAIFPLGTTCVTWTAIDGCGKVKTCTQCVTRRSPFATNCHQIVLKGLIVIQGYYKGNGSMNAAMYNAGAYVSLPGGFSTYDADTITISAVDPLTFAVVDRQKAILGTNGIVYAAFDTMIVEGQAYYIRVNHRNSIETWSAAPVLMTDTTVYNFTTGPAQAYGSNLVDVGTQYGEPPLWAIYSGDISDANTSEVGEQDGIIEAQDYIDMENGVTAILFGYIPQDITGDGVVESFDYIIEENNVTSIIFSIHP